jgi:LysR family transcriptional regulator, glycine cleavage system transcriptional activator
MRSFHRRPTTNIPLGAVRVFESVSRLGSFKAAAEQLAVTPGAISQQIKALEDHLGVRLFERLNRGLRLTPAGVDLAEATQKAFGGLDAALDALTAQGLAARPSRLSISAPTSYATKWLAPRLYRFHLCHPQIETRLLACDAVTDLERDPGVDVVLRYGAGPYPGLDAEPLWPGGEVFPVCSPSLTAGSEPLNKPEDLLRYTLLRVMPCGWSGNSASASQELADWSAWLAAAGIDGLAARKAAISGPLFSNTILAVEAALAGQGVALADTLVVDDDLRSGRLQRPFALSIRDPFTLWLAFRSDRVNEARIRAFATWIRGEVRPESQ